MRESSIPVQALEAEGKGCLDGFPCFNRRGKSIGWTIRAAIMHQIINGKQANNK
jgi:hypothetical protein